MRQLICLVLMFCGLSNGLAAANAAWDGAIYRPDGHAIETREFTTELKEAAIIILGEEHYNSKIQSAQAKVIQSVAVGSAPVVGWEFLNVSQQQNVQKLFEQFKKGETSTYEFLRQTQKAESATYAPILEVIKRLGGLLWAVNLSRAEKAPFVSGSATEDDLRLLPPNFELGSADYFERFKATMVDHVPAEKISNYFTAQCATDDVMAYHLLNSPPSRHKFLVTGAFHSDYFGGVVARLKVRANDPRKVATVRFIDASTHSVNSLFELLSDRVYGPVADYIVFVGEPQSL